MVRERSRLHSNGLDALEARDIERLARATSYPFEVRDKRREARCGKRSAKIPDALKAAVDCLFRGDLLHRALVDSPSPGFTADEPADSLPNWIEERLGCPRDLLEGGPGELILACHPGSRGLRQPALAALLDVATETVSPRTI
jgi:hypothetical protein